MLLLSIAAIKAIKGPIIIAGNKAIMLDMMSILEPNLNDPSCLNKNVATIINTPQIIPIEKNIIENAVLMLFIAMLKDSAAKNIVITPPTIPSMKGYLLWPRVTLGIL